MKKFKFICITFIITSLLLCGCYNSNNVQDTTTDNTKPQPQEVMIETVTFKGIVTDITQQPSDKNYFNITLKSPRNSNRFLMSKDSLNKYAPEIGNYIEVTMTYDDAFFTLDELKKYDYKEAQGLISDLNSDNDYDAEFIIYDSKNPQLKYTCRLSKETYYVKTIKEAIRNGDEVIIKGIVNNDIIVCEQIELTKPFDAKATIQKRADEVITLLKNKNFKELSRYIHPTKGVTFTPYTYVNDSDINFSFQQMHDFANVSKKYLWGQFDGSGEDILMTPMEYYNRFIYEHDYKNADEIGYNKVLSGGNMLENQFKVYKEPIIVEYYFKGFDPQFAGIDWRSLRIVYQQHEGEWYIVGLINNQWTI